MVKLEARGQHDRVLHGWISVPPGYQDHRFVEWPIGHGEAFEIFQLEIKDFRVTVEAQPYRAFVVPPAAVQQLRRLPRFTPA